MLVVSKERDFNLAYDRFDSYHEYRYGIYMSIFNNGKVNDRILWHFPKEAAVIRAINKSSSWNGAVKGNFIAN